MKNYNYLKSGSICRLLLHTLNFILIVTLFSSCRKSLDEATLLKISSKQMSVPTPWFSTGVNLNFKDDFGGVGDGVTNDYPAFIRMTKFVDSVGSATVFFPEGTYYIADYHTSTSTLTDVQFTNVDGLVIYGDNAKIVVNGNFHRAHDYTSGSHKYSRTVAIIPMQFIDCNNVIVSGFEIQGGVANTTRDANIAESGGHLLRFVACTNVEVSDMYLHHAQTDGIVITGKSTKASSNFTVDNITSEYNARQGITITNLINANIANSSFKYSGYTGPYGSHAPAASIDIEPPYLAAGQKTTNINFRNCTFAHSKGGQFTVSRPAYTNLITLRKSTIDASGSESLYSMILTASDIRIDSCDINAANGNIYPRWDVMYDSKTEIKNSTIRGRRSGVIAITTSTTDSIKIVNNKIYYDTTAVLPNYFPYLRAPGLVFNNNEVTILEAGLKPGVNVVLQNGKEVKNNVFKTDNPLKFPNVSYTGTATVSGNTP